MKIVTRENKISLDEVKELAENSFGDLVKAVVDIELEIMAVGGELHSDAEALLIKNGSRQKDVWGVNIYPGNLPEQRIKFDSMINLRPSAGNKSRNVENAQTQKRIKEIVNSLLE